MQFHKELYTIQEVADLFEVTKPTVYDWMNNRGLRWVQLGARRRISRAELERFVMLRSFGATDESSSVYNSDTTKTPGHAAA